MCGDRSWHACLTITLSRSASGLSARWVGRWVGREGKGAVEACSGSLLRRWISLVFDE